MNRRAQFIAERRTQAEAMVAVVERLHPGALAALRDDPLGEIGTWTDVQLRFCPETGAGDRCSIAGSYDDETEPPTLIIGRAASLRRRGFTALHELGHHLQQTHPELGQRLFTVRDSQALEEASCDEFASQVLLPADQVAVHFGDRGPTATGVVSLIIDSRASREACCVRAANFLVGAGAVLLLDRAGTVVFAAPRGMVPPARGSDQSSCSLVSVALHTNATVERDEVVLTYSTGHTTDLLYGQAAWCDEDYLVAVVASDNVPWRPFAPPRPGTRRSQLGSWWTCETETCADTFMITEAPCGQCGQPRCSHGHCGCTAARAQQDRVCTSCYLKLAPSRFDGASAVCRDCA